MTGRPWSDGVEYVTECPIGRGENFTYGFDSNSGAPPGTYWYHSHVESQRTNGAYAALIIKERSISSRFDVDDARNTLVIQEWYRSSSKRVPLSILTNGKGKVGGYIHAIPENVDPQEFLTDYLHSKQKLPFSYIPNPDMTDKTNYEVFNITEPGKKYRFRLIGSISENVPIRVSVENHTFTAIATDSLDIQSVENLEAVWLTAGERYDIVIQTKVDHGQNAFKIKLYGVPNPNSGNPPLCSIAWLKYPGQIIDYSYTIENCTDFIPDDFVKTLNPVPNNLHSGMNQILCIYMT